MDILTLSLAVKKALAALGVKIAPSEVLTWDGNVDDTEMILGAFYACKITDKYMDLNSVESFVVKYDNGDTKTLTASECIVRTDMGMQFLMTVEDETPYVFSSPADVEGMMNKGLYLVLSSGFYVEKITFAETIVPIDQKYLPKGGAGYIERSDPIVIISKGSYEFYNGSYETQITKCPNAGDLITLTLDGAVYSATAKSHVLEDGTEIVYIGNGAVDGGEDTGETYFAGFMSSAGAAVVALVAEAGNEQTSTHTVEVSYTTQNIVPILPQFMPCVTLETIVSTAETTMSEADAKKLDALAAVGMPAVLKFKYEFPASGDAAGWCSYMKAEGTTVFKCRFGAYETEISFTFSDAGGEWKCYYSVE